MDNSVSRADALERRRQRDAARKDRERQMGRLMAYRRAVIRIAGGQELSQTQAGELAGVMDGLGLPEYAMSRDVRAAMRWPNADRLHRAQLWNDHPHLFDDAEDWVRRWQTMNDRRRRARL